MPTQDQQYPPPKGTGEPYRRLKCILSQAGVADPTCSAANRLENNLLETQAFPVLARTNVGLYTMTLTGAFNGTVHGYAQVVNGATGFMAKIVKTSANVLTIQVLDAAGAAADLVGDLMLSVEVWPS